MDAFSIEKNTNFKIAYDGKTDEGENEPIKITEIKDGKSEEIEITALTTFTEKQDIIIKDYLNREVGKIEMAPNDTVDLAVKIIPVVFSEATKVTDANTLHQKTLKASINTKGDLKKALQTKSLNQAGVLCNIDSVNNSNPECIVIDVTKDNWDKFYNGTVLSDWEYVNDTLKPAPSTDEDGDKRYHARDLGASVFLLDKLESEYYKKYGKSHKGALIFVSDKGYSDPLIQGYSQTDPIRSQGTIIFNNGLNDATVFAHELGHMLGLEHNFVKDTNELNETNSKLNDLTRSGNVTDRKQQIESNITAYENYLNELKSKKEPTQFENRRITEIPKEDIPNTEKSIIREKDKLRKIDIKTTTANFKVTKGKSKNYMDYINNRTYFNKYQMEIAKNEVNSFYK
ncbi:hypothetical protein OAT18_01035 [Tenacibaculum sp.]|nr:hypothetical protein [Tenacibaculum sp.]